MDLATEPSLNFCENCSRNIDPSLIFCPHCEHDQRTPILRKHTSAAELTNAVFVFCRATFGSDIKEFLEKEEAPFWKTKKRSAIRFELVLNHLVLAYLTFDMYFSINPQRAQLNDIFFSQMAVYLDEMLGRTNAQRALKEFKERVAEYHKSWGEEDWVRAISILFQARVEAAARGEQFLGSDWANPDISSLMFYATHANLFVIHLKLMLNRWTID